MIGKMIVHAAAAALVIGVLAFGWQAFASKDGVAVTSQAVSGLVGGGHGQGHGDD